MSENYLTPSQEEAVTTVRCLAEHDVSIPAFLGKELLFIIKQQGESCHLLMGKCKELRARITELETKP